MANYEYQTIYGIEQYDPLEVPVSSNFGGGADVSNNNLLITLWNLPGYQGSGVPAGGQLLKPFIYTGDGALATAGAASGGVGLPGGFQQVCKSRYSSKFYLKDVNLGSVEDPDYELVNFVMAILQPPQDIVNDWLTYAKNLKVDPSVSSGFTLDFLKSFFYPLAWHFEASNVSFTPNAEAAAFGGFFNVASSFAMTKTSGADGVFPEFYPQTNAGLFQLLQDVTNGKPFYIPCIFSRNQTLDTETPEMFEISWLGSNAKR